jgi:hypothetical protein
MASARRPERTDLAGMHQVGEYGEGFLDVGRGVGAVDPAPGVAAAGRALAHREVHFRGQYDVLPSALECLADDLLALAGGVRGSLTPKPHRMFRRRASWPLAGAGP